MRTWMILLCPLVVGCEPEPEMVTSRTINKQNKAAAHSIEEPSKKPRLYPSMQLTGSSGEVRVRIATHCNCAKKPTLDVTTTDKLITIQGVLPDGPLARCSEGCVLYTKATELSPGNYRVIYLPAGAGEPKFSGEVAVD